MNESYADIGTKMKKKREDAGVALRAIAKALNYSAPYVLDLETGKRSWSPLTQPKLQKVYLTAVNRVKTAHALIKKRKAARFSGTISCADERFYY